MSMSASKEKVDELHSQLKYLGINSCNEIIEDLLKRSATIDGAIEYYLCNQNLFDNKYSTKNDDSFNLKSNKVDDNFTIHNVQTNEDILCEIGFDPERVRHALQRCSTLEAAVNLLLSNKANTIDIKEPNIMCPICSDEFPASKLITLNCSPDPHRFCNDCFIGYCTHKISEAQVQSDQLVCPARLENTGKICGTEITVFELHANLPSEIYEKYLRFITRSYCEHEKMKRCPKCNDWFVDISHNHTPEIIWKDVTCGNCNHHFCGKCGERPHKASKDQDIDCKAFAAWKQQNEKSDDSFKNYIQEKHIFPCPTCGEAGQLEQGCKYLYCRCKGHFCALCGVKLTEAEHFTHFLNAPFGEKCLNKP